MIAMLSAADRWMFIAINSWLANPVGDVVWPWITDYDKHLIVRILLVGVWLMLVIRGGARGRTVALLLIPVLVAADQFSSALLKQLIQRPRPCHTVDGARVIDIIHLIVPCGSGKSFPSSHAVNNFAVATLLAAYYRRLWPYVFGWASIVAISRVAVGVHFPSDIAGGAVIGICISLGIVAGWQYIAGFLPAQWKVTVHQVKDPPEPAA